jgi:hypothetical protein
VLKDAARVAAVLALPAGYEYGLDDYCEHDIQQARQTALTRLLGAKRLAIGWLPGDPVDHHLVVDRARILGWVISRDGAVLGMWDAVPYGRERPVGARPTARAAAVLLVSSG